MFTVTYISVCGTLTYGTFKKQKFTIYSVLTLYLETGLKTLYKNERI